MVKYFKRTIAICMLVIIILLLTSCDMLGFECEHCRQFKWERPHDITYHTVDMSICSECYERYMQGEWRIQ